VRLPGCRFVGSLLFLAAHSDWSIRVVLDGSDGAAPLAALAAASTRAGAPAPPPGATWRVDAAKGSDANPGTASQPLGTIQCHFPRP